MKAVNFIPPEQRRRGALPLARAGKPTLLLIAALTIALVAVVAAQLASNAVQARRDELALTQRRLDAAHRRLPALERLRDAAQARQERLTVVRRLAGPRLDWGRLLGDVSRALPADATLTTLAGSAPGAAAGSETGTATQPSPAGATGGSFVLDLAGCTADHAGVARIMDRLRAVRDVSDVRLVSSATTAQGTGDTGAAGCRRPDRFEVAVTVGGLLR